MPAPAWFHDAILYHILIDRFAGLPEDGETRALSPVFAGGTLQGIREQLPYLEELGVNTLWISPFCAGAGYHGYHSYNDRSVDPHFGTEKDLRALIGAAHAAGFRIIADWVPNHWHESHPFFQRALQGDRAYRRWFYFQPDGSHLGYGGYGFLPKINLDHPPARAFMIESARHWMQMGLDGYRLDYAVGPSRDFWRVFRREIKAVNPEAVLIGEVWLGSVKKRDLPQVDILQKEARWLRGRIPKGELQREYAGLMDGVLDFAAQELYQQHIAKGAADEPLLRTRLRLHQRRAPRGFVQPAFLDNHDMNRFLHESGQDRDRLKQALAVLFSQPQPPILYYGTEIGLTHAETVWSGLPYADLATRGAMIWDPARQDLDLKAHVQTLIAARKRQHAVQPAEAVRVF
jgi:glycosidase